MKKDLHPTYFSAATVTCACGTVYTMGSTKEKIEVEICSACHPFFTGNEKVLDSAGRVERFKARAAAKAPAKKKTKTTEK
jgi:large subunit ribosomal protein L31